MFEGITVHDAKRKLYQPEVVEVEVDTSLSALDVETTKLFSADSICSPAPRKTAKSKETNFQFDDSSYFDENPVEELRPVARARTPSWDDYAASWQNVKLSDLRPLKFIERKSRRIKDEYGPGAHFVWVLVLLGTMLLATVYIIFPMVNRYYTKKQNIAPPLGLEI